MAIFSEDLDELAAEADLLAEKIQAVALEGGSAILAHAAATARSVAAGVRRAIVKAEAKAERAAAFSEQRSRDVQEREYDALTKQLADQRGVPYEEMARIRKEAAGRARVAANAGPIDEQLERLSR